MLAGLGDLRTSEDLQTKSLISLVEASTAAARRQHEAALRHARGTLVYADVLGVSAEDQRWAWPLAARAAHELADFAAVRDLLSLLDSYQPGQIAPMLRAERYLAQARLDAAHGGQAADGDQAAAASFAAAVTGLRERGTPYHLAHGLLDYAEYLTRTGDADAAAQAVLEARDIARRLRCQPLLDRADAIEGAPSRIHT
jgi:hypothetical protein